MSVVFDWEHRLKQLFAATVNQGTLEEAADLMVEFSNTDEEYHNECMYLFEKARELSESKDERILTYINKSGYIVNSFQEADELIEEFREIYINKSSKYN